MSEPLLLTAHRSLRFLLTPYPFPCSAVPLFVAHRLLVSEAEESAREEGHAH